MPVFIKTDDCKHKVVIDVWTMMSKLMENCHHAYFCVPFVGAF